MNARPRTSSSSPVPAAARHQPASAASSPRADSTTRDSGASARRESPRQSTAAASQMPALRAASSQASVASVASVGPIGAQTISSSEGWRSLRRPRADGSLPRSAARAPEDGRTSGRRTRRRLSPGPALPIQSPPRPDGRATIPPRRAPDRPGCASDRPDARVRRGPAIAADRLRTPGPARGHAPAAPTPRPWDGSRPPRSGSPAPRRAARAAGDPGRSSPKCTAPSRRPVSATASTAKNSAENRPVRLMAPPPASRPRRDIPGRARSG